jgi:rubredoxin
MRKSIGAAPAIASNTWWTFLSRTASNIGCPHCGAEKDVYYKPGKKITCSACGKEFEI